MANFQIQIALNFHYRINIVYWILTILHYYLEATSETDYNLELINLIDQDIPTSLLWKSTDDGLARLLRGMRVNRKCVQRLMQNNGDRSHLSQTKSEQIRFRSIEISLSFNQGGDVTGSCLEYRHHLRQAFWVVLRIVQQ